MAQVLELLDIDDRMFGSGATVHWAGLWHEVEDARVDNRERIMWPYFGIVINVSATNPHKPLGRTLVYQFTNNGRTYTVVDKENPFTVNLSVPVSVDEFGDTFGDNPGQWFVLRADGTWHPRSFPGGMPTSDTALAYDDEDAGLRERIPFEGRTQSSVMSRFFVPADEIGLFWEGA